MAKYVFYAHSGSGNHGCEAIVRSSELILDNSVDLYSMHPDQDKFYGLDKVTTWIGEDKDNVIHKYSFPWFASRLQTKITKSIDNEIYYRKYGMLKHVKPEDIWFSIGGDNYCYPGTDILNAERNIIQKKGAKVVLWGCSVEPNLLSQKEILEDISAYDLITARESISYEALRKINKNTILVPDPAFTLQKKELPLPDGWINNNMVGINVSPLVLNCSENSSTVYDAYHKLISYILKETTYGIALIPHVVWANNDDRKPLNRLYDSFYQTGRVVMVQDCNCMELKGYIARCRLFVGARTHATIAAYSTGVPTLVLGYSVKSRGIANDLFGTDQNYVIPVQNLTDSNELTNKFVWLLDNAEAIRKHLNKIMAEYVQKAYLAKIYVEKLY